MSRSGLAPVVSWFDDAADIDSLLVTERVQARRDHDVGQHAHTAHELLWGFDGPRTIETERATWQLPPTIALWIPAGVAHTGVVAAQSSYYCTFVHPDRSPVAWAESTPVALTPVLRELLVHLHEGGLAADARERAERVALDQVRPLATASIPLRMPVDARARRVAAALVADPGDRRTLEAWGDAVGAVGRTLNRRFVRETGMAFHEWRINARVRAAIALLATGRSVAEVGHRVGYETPSAFVRAFRRVTGETPGRYLGERPYAASADVDPTRFDTIKA